MLNSQKMNQHFEKIASIYDDVRNTDSDIVETIINQLPQIDHPLYIADIGSGTGRYSKIIAKYLKEYVRLCCCDVTKAMVEKCKEEMTSEFSNEYFKNFCGNANELPFKDNSFFAVTTFNAVHHFDLDCFVRESARILHPGGLLAIYTRTSKQNAETVWGRYFPGFTEYETRLFTLSFLEKAINCVTEVRLLDIKTFNHSRIETVDSLVTKARNFHYSTFSLYPAKEFNLKLDEFVRRLSEKFLDGIVNHSSGNVLVLAERV